MRRLAIMERGTAKEGLGISSDISWGLGRKGEGRERGGEPYVDGGICACRGEVWSAICESSIDCWWTGLLPRNEKDISINLIMDDNPCVLQFP